MDRTFSKRLFKHLDELKTLYDQLYNDESAFAEFCDGLSRYFEKRPESLRNIDAKRVKNPNWYMSQDMAGLELHMENDVRTFRDVQSVLGYYSKIGYNILDLGFILSTPKKISDAGAITDYRKVGSSYGSMEELTALAASCHRRQMRLCIDVNMSFTADNHKWAKKTRALDKTYMTRYIRTENGDDANRYDDLADVEMGDRHRGNFTYQPDNDFYVMTTFKPYEWDLNYKNPMVMNKMFRNLLYLANQGVDIFRIHDDRYLWKDISRGCMNPEETQKAIRILKLAIEIVCPGVLIWTEWSDQGQFIEDSEIIDIVWHTLATQNCRLMKAHMDKMNSYPKEMLFSNVLMDDSEIEWKLDYGLLAEEAIEKESHINFLNKYYSGRMGSVAEMTGLAKALVEGTSEDLDTAKKKYILIYVFILMKCGMPVICERDENILPEIHELILKLKQMRSDDKVFNVNADRWTMDTWDEGTFAMGRYFDGEKLLAIMNFSDTDRTAWINENDGDYYELITGETMPAEGVSVPAYGYKLLKKTF